MASSADGSFVNRRACTLKEISDFKNRGIIIPSHVPSATCKIDRDSMSRIIRYVSRLNYQHFSQFRTPLPLMTSTEFKMIKEIFYLEIMERWTIDMLHGRGSASKPATERYTAEEEFFSSFRVHPNNCWSS